MRNKINSACEQIHRKAVVDALMGKLNVIMTAAIQLDQFEFYSAMVCEELDKIVNTFKEDEKETA